MVLEGYDAKLHEAPKSTVYDIWYDTNLQFWLITLCNPYDKFIQHKRFADFLSRSTNFEWLLEIPCRWFGESVIAKFWRKTTGSKNPHFQLPFKSTAHICSIFSHPVHRGKTCLCLQRCNDWIVMKPSVLQKQVWIVGQVQSQTQLNLPGLDLGLASNTILALVEIGMLVPARCPPDWRRCNWTPGMWLSWCSRCSTCPQSWQALDLEVTKNPSPPGCWWKPPKALVCPSAMAAFGQSSERPRHSTLTPNHRLEELKVRMAAEFTSDHPDFQNWRGTVRLSLFKVWYYGISFFRKHMYIYIYI